MKEPFESYLIDAVKKQPALYDRNAVGYNNKEDIENAWIEVTKEVSKNINNINVNHCKLRWRTLRDRFVKQIAKTPDGIEHFKPEAKRWEYTNRLYFLTEHLKKRKCEEAYVPRHRKKESNKSNRSEKKTQNFSFVETKSMHVTPENSGSYFYSENETKESETDPEPEPEIEIPLASPSPKRAKFESPEFFLESETEEPLLVSNDDDTKSKLNVNEDTLNKLLNTTNELLQLQIKQSTQKSPNEAYFKVLDSYFAKLPSNEVDRVKVEILNLILVKQSSLIKRQKMKN